MRSPLTLRLCEASVTAARWSSVTPAASHNSRPISVDFPSSTEPHVSSLSSGAPCGASAAARLGATLLAWTVCFSCATFMDQAP